jgi:catechol 2,3-dioxygenase-like lactoylglutathione lyase family enzyme
MPATFEAIHPVLGARDVAATARWYVDRLGFVLIFADGDPVRYAVLRRDAVELHLQWHDVETFAGADGDAPMYRIQVDDPDALYADLKGAGVLHAGSMLRDTAWGTREFGIYDPNRMGLAFYRLL